MSRTRAYPCYGITIMIDIENRVAVIRPPGEARERPLRLTYRTAASQGRRRRRKHIAAMEARRGFGRDRQKHAGIDPCAPRDHLEEPVVRSHVMASFGFKGDRPAGTTYSRIDYRHDNGPRWDVPTVRRHEIGRGLDRKIGKTMKKIDDGYARGQNAEPEMDLPYIGVIDTKIGQ